ncbi:MAG TPA: hypothetical protein VF824_15360 [Thermoanaerobaculia bacterium]|jgi:hypothetical protein
MKRLLFLLLALAPLVSFAQTRAPYPDDYKPSPCAAGQTCRPIDQYRIVRMGFQFQGYEIDSNWLAAHIDELRTAAEPACQKIVNCYATKGNYFIFCNELGLHDMLKVCDRWPKDSKDHRQCEMTLRAWQLTNDFGSRPQWEPLQACAKENFHPSGKPPEVWMVPEKIGADYKGKFTVYAIDADTHAPLMADVRIENQNVYAPDVPNGQPTTSWPVPWKVTYVRVPNAAGHTDLRAPNVTVTAADYPPVVFAMPVDVPRAIVEMTPAPSKLKRGKNHITIHARDAVTGKPVELRVMAGSEVLGDSNQPLTLELARGKKRPEIWVTSLFNQYSDVVVMPREK